MNRIYHNPRCSKSRQTLALLRQKNVDVDIVLYLETPPSRAELDVLCTMLGIEPTGLLRTKEKLFRELGLSVSDVRSRQEWLSLLATHPRLIERPIVVLGDQAALGRPPENILTLIADVENAVEGAGVRV